MKQPNINIGELSERFVAALETMCFVIADPVDPATAPDVERHASILLGEGSDALSLFISASDGLLLEVASGLMGVGPDEIQEEEVLAETLKELANVFGGEVIALLGGEELPLRPGIPVSESSGSEAKDAVCVALDALGDGLVVSISPVVDAA